MRLLTRSQCKVSDTRVTVKACGPRVKNKLSLIIFYTPDLTATFIAFIVFCVTFSKNTFEKSPSYVINLLQFRCCENRTLFYSAYEDYKK